MWVEIWLRTLYSKVIQQKPRWVHIAYLWMKEGGQQEYPHNADEEDGSDGTDAIVSDLLDKSDKDDHHEQGVDHRDNSREQELDTQVEGVRNYARKRNLSLYML